MSDSNNPTQKRKLGHRRLAKKAKFEYALRMRLNPTEAEAILWGMLRRKQLGVGFRQQAVIFGFIADFYSPAAKLVVELDGPLHTHQQRYDEDRAKKMATIGLLTLRFPNELLFERPELVLNTIRAACTVRAPRQQDSAPSNFQREVGNDY